MNEAQIEKQTVWRKSLNVLAIGYLVLSSASFATYAVGKENEYNKLNSITEETKQTLHETTSKVEVQDKEIKTLLESNKGLETLNQKNDLTITELSTRFHEAEDKITKQQKKIQQLESELKNKKASRNNPSVASASSVNVSGMMKFRSTAYSDQEPYEIGGGVITASGTHVTEGRTIAVDPRVIKLGSKVKIICPDFPSVNGVYLAEDTGGAIKGNIIDIYMHSESKTIQFGRRTIYVEILN